MEYQAGDGSRFTLLPRSCILSTDTTGQGHASCNVGSEAIRLALVQMKNFQAEHAATVLELSLNRTLLD